MSDDPELDKLREEAEALGLDIDSDSQDDYGSPKPSDKDNLFRFFRSILGMKDTTKVGNLTSLELGMSKLGVRHYQDLALYANAEGLNVVAMYLQSKSNVITSTSMSKKGFWSQLFVTQIKKEQKMKEPILEKKGFFSKKTEEVE